MAGDVSAVLAAVLALQARVDAWSAEAAHDEDEARSLIQSARDANQTELNTLRSDVMARMVRLQNRLDTMRDGLTVDCGANEHTDRIARDALEETRP